MLLIQHIDTAIYIHPMIYMLFIQHNNIYVIHTTYRYNDIYSSNDIYVINMTH